MARTAPTPKHLWIIAVIALLWNAMGCFDYLMTQTENEQYMAQFTQEQLDFFYGFPMWFEVFWALAVWGSLAGSILLLLRNKLAMPVYTVSFVSMVITSVYSYGFSNGAELMGAMGLVFSLLIFVIALFLVLYSRAMAARGVLG
jgi:hypothetical protein